MSLDLVFMDFGVVCSSLVVTVVPFFGVGAVISAVCISLVIAIIDISMVVVGISAEC